ncbi:MAG: hypothetical protein QOJ15_22 [Bradyrhizobium sp.]|jgi:hypothetical protein|nr:hypothetical protein [Bradyrhizobium sp.]
MQYNVSCRTAFHRVEPGNPSKLVFGGLVRMVAVEGGRDHKRGLKRRHDDISFRVSRTLARCSAGQPGESEPLAKTSRASWTIHGFESSCWWRDGGAN